MQAKVYDIDAAVARAVPRIRLRGVLYQLKDMSLRDRLRRLQDFQRRQQALVRKATTGKRIKTPQQEAEVEDSMQRIMADAIHEALDGVPQDVAESVTEMEFDAIIKAVNAARMTDVEVEGKVEEVPDDAGESESPTPTP